MIDATQEVQEQNQDCCEHFEIEVAFQGRPGAMQRGIGIEIQGQDMPVFISCDQLRRLADEAEAY